MAKKVLIIGATSAIAEATARRFAQRGDRLFLVARNEERLVSISKDLSIRGASGVDYALLEVTDFDRHAGVIERAEQTMDGIDIALIAHGTLPDQKACEDDVKRTFDEIHINAISTISLLTCLANVFERRGQGTLAVISSVAGDRGRQSNYVYGAAKAAVSTFMQGLRNRLYRSGVHVLTIKPGFVDTPMTQSFKKGALWAQPDDIAKGILRGIDKKKNEIYLPWFWRIIMFIIRLIPETLFKRLNL